MNPEVKAKWVAALRSGEYKQGRGYLKVNDTYCCLGVLCEVLGVESKPVTEDSDFVPYHAFEGAATYPPDSVVAKAELPFDNPNPRVLYQGVVRSLADLNDEWKLSFAEIADLIEKQL